MYLKCTSKIRYARAALINRNIMQATDIILNFLKTTFKKVKKAHQIKVNNIFYLAQYIQNIITATCNQCNKLLKKYVVLLFSYWVFETWYVLYT